MALHTLQIVESIAASPTVLLDLNDGATWRCTNFDAAPPRLRRAMSENAMRDGVFVSSSAYGPRELALTLVVVSSTQDANASQLQALARVLDRDDVYLKWQPAGATKPVFFKLFRSDFESLAELRGQTAAREGVVRLLADPFALGLRETLGPYTVTNDPAAGSNGCYFDVTGVIGDVRTPFVAIADETPDLFYMSIRQHGTPADLVFFAQAESCSLGTDTTNPGGGPDAAMSGADANNYARTSFATTATMAARVSWTLPGAATSDAAGVALRGTYRVVAFVRRSGSSSVFTLQWSRGVGYDDGAIVTLPTTSARQMVDLGLISLNTTPDTPGYSSTITPLNVESLHLRAARTGAAETLDWDCVLLLPADEATMIFSRGVGPATAHDLVIDGIKDSAYAMESGADLFAGTAWTKTYGTNTYRWAGSIPSLIPNQTNRIYFTRTASTVSAVTDATVLTLHYWPRYLYVRPSAS